MNEKHAYLIICHNNYKILEKLIKQLDYPLNDIYIHVDKKVNNFPFDYFVGLVEYSTLYFTERVNVNWGGYSQIQAELILLNEAKNQNYKYYHLLSGVDMVLKSQKEIHEFFDNNFPKQFIEFDNVDLINPTYLDRIRWYYLFQDKIGRNKGKIIALYSLFETISLNVQKKLNVNRISRKICYQKGANWFSITDELAQYIVSNEKKIFKIFKYSIATDEMFIHTLVANSHFMLDVVNDNLRLIDWNRGLPYTFTREDYELLISSNKFFARKFDENVDFEIVEMIFNKVMEEKNT